MKPDHGKLLYEGKAKRVYAMAEGDSALIEFKDDTTAFNAQKKAQLNDKGWLNCQISACLFELLKQKGVPTHYLGLVGNAWMKVQRVHVIPLEVVLRNTAAGSLCEQMPIAQGTQLKPALLDLYYKDDGLGDPLLTEARVKLLEVVDEVRLSAIKQLGHRVNEVLCSFFAKINLQLVDLKLEFGVSSAGQLLLADEISPDTCRLWDYQSPDVMDRILDKDRFRHDLGGVIEAYREILERIHSAYPRSPLL
ncbi:phosphoribosylaminoimidazolesuccinocarboxamide synthase [Synechococcus sp. M16CYN]|uniref:phosphoribosylaminoimidazolesuccinocarboxamide synthase n=1 Tax=Synechococcus sp. M16CYN TaxID=3103139 RepID=UPI0030E124AC